MIFIVVLRIISRKIHPATNIPHFFIGFFLTYRLIKTSHSFQMFFSRSACLTCKSFIFATLNDMTRNQLFRRTRKLQD
ncbi:hypothetical protein WL02_00620 [Burkholderia ubonensis]|nr:hypothetical protein WL02_00620 [Burkholderia ubonensis]